MATLLNLMFFFRSRLARDLMKTKKKITDLASPKPPIHVRNVRIFGLTASMRKILIAN